MVTWVLMGVNDDNLRNSIVAPRADAGNIADAGADCGRIGDQRRRRGCPCGRRTCSVRSEWRPLGAENLPDRRSVDVLGARQAGELRTGGRAAALQIECALDVFRSGEKQWLRGRDGKALCRHLRSFHIFGPRTKAGQRICTTGLYLRRSGGRHGDAASHISDSATGGKVASSASAAFDVYRAASAAQSTGAVG